jgi:hypothetical protein
MLNIDSEPMATPAGFAKGKELFRDFDADHVGSGVLGAGLAAAGAVPHPSATAATGMWSARFSSACTK